MNPDRPKNAREALEIKITALLLGELDPAEETRVREAIAADAELQRLHDEMTRTVELVQAATQSPESGDQSHPAEPLRLSEKKRGALFAKFKTLTVAPPRRPASPRVGVRLVELAAVIAVMAILAAMLLPAMSKSKSKAKRITVVNNLKQVELAKQMWAQDNEASPDAAPTKEDLEPYLAGDWLRSVEGETYSLGTVSEPAVARFDPDSGLRSVKGLEKVELGDGRDEYLLRASSYASPKRPAAVTPLASAPVIPDFEPLPSSASSPSETPASYARYAGVPPSASGRSSVAIALPSGKEDRDTFYAFQGSAMTGTQWSYAGGLAGNDLMPSAQPTDAFGRFGAKGVEEVYRGNLSAQTAGRDAGGAAEVHALSGMDFFEAPRLTSRYAAFSGASASPPATPAPLGDVSAGGGGGGGGGLAMAPTGGARIVRGAPVTSSSGAGVTVEEGEQVRFFNRPMGQPFALDDSKATVAKGVRSSGEEPAQSRARIALNYATASNVATAIKSVAPNSRVEITSDGQLSIEGTQDDLASVEGMVRMLDTPTRQLVIEAAVKETRDKLESSGKPVAAGAHAADAITLGGEREAELQAGRQYFSLGVPQQRGAATADSFRLLGSKEEEPDVAPARKPSPDAPTPQPEILTTVNPFSTFSLNVSDVSFKLAAASLEQGQMPDTASIRSEEFVNAFDYRDPAPTPGQPLAFAWERARYPFAHNRDLLRFSVQTAARGRQPGRPLNLVLLLDNSGSMERADRVSIIRECLNVLAGQLTAQDKVSVVAFARTARLWVDGVPGVQAPASLAAAGQLTPEGGTNLEEAMNLAYATAHRHYLADGVNRVVLLTDGAANLGNVEPESLKAQVEGQRKQGIALDCFGIGWEGYNDDLLEVLSRNGDGRYGFVNTPQDASREFAAQLAGALQVAASDVKMQVEFNPARATAYRQIGYAKHQLTKEQFRDNTVDAAEIGAAESGNALYVVQTDPNGQGPIATVRARFKVPATGEYKEYSWTVPYTGEALGLGDASPTMRLAGTASAFSEWLAASPYAGDVGPNRLLGLLRGVPEVFGPDPRPTQLETMIREAARLAGN